MRCLITGCEGFLGSHLADLLVSKNVDVVGLVFEDACNLKHLDGKITTVEVDLRDQARVRSAVESTSPDVVFHLAAQSFVTVSWQDPELTLATNVLGTFYLLEALREQGSKALIEVVGSSAVYGPCSAGEMPLREGQEFRPTSMYAVSKVTEDMLAYFYWRVFGLRIVRVRPFNMTGPRKTGDAVSDFARGVVDVEKGRRDILEVGNLDAVRDYSDGRDGAEALWLLAARGEPGETYQICSGQERSLRSVLHELLSIASIDVPVVTSPSKLRPHDDPIYVGDLSRLRKLGWEPRIPFAQTLADTLQYWREAGDRGVGNSSLNHLAEGVSA